MLSRLGLFNFMYSKLNWEELKDNKKLNATNSKISNTINWILSVNIEALNPPYKV